jgi:hypothetical protein
MKFAIRMSPLVRPFLLFIGATAVNSYVEVGAEAVRLRFGPAFEHEIRRDNIADVVPGRWSVFDGFGVRAGWRIVGLIGSTSGVVEIHTRENVTLPFAGVAVDRAHRRGIAG